MVAVGGSVGSGAGSVVGDGVSVGVTAKVWSVFKTAKPKQAADRLDDAVAYSQAPEAVPELHSSPAP